MLSQTLIRWIAEYGYVAIFSLLTLGIVGLPVPDETLLTFAGFLVHQGSLQPLPTLAAAFLGSCLGMTLSYALGRTLGLFLLHKYGHWVGLSQEKLDRVHRWFERAGRWTLTFGYFFPGVRHLTAYVAGVSKLELPVFALFAFTGGFFWSAVFLSLGYFLGKRWAGVSETMRGPLLLASAVVAVAGLLYWLVKWKKKKSSPPLSSNLPNP